MVLLSGVAVAVAVGAAAGAAVGAAPGSAVVFAVGVAVGVAIGASVSAAAESGTCRLSIRPFCMCSVRASHGFTNTVQFTQSVGLVSVR